jgi:urocanate hydratase
METSEEFNHTHREQGYHITMPHLAEDALIDRVLKEKGIKHQ